MSDVVPQEPTAWRSACAATSCVEVRRRGDEYLIRDSKNLEQEPLRFTAAEWHAFTGAVAAGKFDDL